MLRSPDQPSTNRFTRQVCRAIHDHCRVLDRLFPSLRGFVRDFALATPGGAVFEKGGVTGGIVPTMRDRSVVNSVVYDDPAELEELLPEIAAAYDEAGILAWTVWAHEGDAAAIGALETAGNAFDAEPMAMARELDGIDPPGGDLDFVRDPEPDAVAEVLADAYHWESFRDALTGWFDGYHPYVALVDGSPVCTVAIRDQDGDAQVQLVGTLERARGRGLASMLLGRALADARERGCTTTTLVATKMGYPVYARLGYRDFGRVQMWERRKPDPGAA
jgi:GNAT superfamily N-acetyltransferase